MARECVCGIVEVEEDEEVGRHKKAFAQQHRGCDM